MNNSHVTTEAKQQAIISWLAQRCGDSGSLGKTAIQKLIYILTYAKNVRTGYDFSLYTYGPYSKNLQGDLDTADYLKAISLTYIEDENRYVVEKSAKTDQFIAKAGDFIAENTESLEWVAKNLGTKSARYLELFSTLHYIITREKVEGDNSVIDRLIEVKPKFDRRETSECLSEVKRLTLN
ncbi:hypothetical protein [Aureimonas sp. AU20]|uniref:hypothetical protein n=1 Tax=Aureimonas sp. AU20 TaxID=1349819 RepID=UPI00071EC7D3|nr:hypothetical protein [Aureimonas sp. AU20]ALN72774.1 hypothetical protein M673_08612 [Aureimonas sp. AU20]